MQGFPKKLRYISYYTHIKKKKQHHSNFSSKAGPFTLDSHIHIKALKTQGFPKKKMMPY